MFSLDIVDTDKFLEMPQSSRLLYYELCIRADDDGFISNPLKIQRLVGCSNDDFNMLILKQFIIPFDTGIIVIKHWRIHNYIQRDRYKPTIYLKEKNSLNLEKKTLKYYLFGAGFLMLSITILPKFVGIYALILGLFSSYITTAILNLKLINKTTIIKPKYKGFILGSFLFLLPSSLLGLMLKNIALNFFGITFSVLFSTFIVVIFNYLFYRIFDLFDILKIFKNK